MCWLSVDRGLIWAFVVPALVVILVRKFKNIVSYFIVCGTLLFYEEKTLFRFVYIGLRFDALCCIRTLLF